MIELLQVTDTFQLSGIGLTLLPDFAVPGTGWKSQSSPVQLLVPDGSTTDATAQFNLTHFNINDPAADDERRWRVIVSLPDLQKSTVPIGSKLLAPPELCAHLLSRSEA